MESGNKIEFWRKKMKIKKESFGFVKDQEIFEYTLKTSKQLSVSVITYGGIITKMIMPDRYGDLGEITVNKTTLDEIVQERSFHGAIVGPVAGRISGARYIDGDKYIELEKNENGNTLHSGSSGLDNKVWEAEIEENEKEASLILTTILKDGEGGFPGEVKVKVIYTLNEENELEIRYEAETNKRTLFNPTNHVYFNLSGNYENSIYAHELQVNSNFYATLNEENIPTGELKEVTDTAFDLREGNKIGNIIINNEEEEIIFRKGLDHPFLVNSDSQEPIVKLSDVASGRVLEIETDRDAVVIYTHNHIQESVTGKGRLLWMHSGIALETQQLPDAVNQKGFGSIWLEPGEDFTSTTTYKFSIME